MRRCKLGVILLAFSFLAVHFTCPKVFNFCPRVSSVFSSQVVYADTNLSENDQGKVKEYYKSARQYYKKNNYERTIAECQKMLEIDAYNANAHKLIKRVGERLKKAEVKELARQRKEEAKAQIAREKELAEKEERAEREQLEAQKQAEKESKLEEKAQIRLQKQREKALKEQRREEARIEKETQKQAELENKNEAKELAAQQKAEEQAALEAKRQARRDIELKEEVLKEQLRREEQIEKQARKLKQEKLDELFDVAKGLYSDKRYNETIAQCAVILKIDSDNKSVQKLIVKSEENIQIVKEKELANREKLAEQARLEAQKQAEKESKLEEKAQIRLQKQREKALKEQRREEARIEKETQKQAELKKSQEAKKLVKQKEAEEKSAAETSKLAKQKAEEDTKKESALIALQKKKVEEHGQIKKEELESRIETHYKNGKKLYRNDEYSAAIEKFNDVLSLDSAHEGAKEYLEASEESLEEQGKREFARQASAAKKQIERKEGLRKRDIQDRITDAKIKVDTGEYDEAIKMLEGILPDVLDENLRRSVELLISKTRTEKTVKEEKLSRKKLRTISDEWMSEVTKAQLPPAEAKRLKELERKKGKTDAVRELRDKASSIKVPLVKYTGTDLRDVVLFLIKQTGINIVVDESIFSGGASAPVAAPAAEGGEGAAVQPAAVQPAAVVAQPTGPVNTKVTCFLQNMTLLSVLEAILRPKGLDYKFTKEYIWVSTNARILTQPLEDMETRVYSLEYGAAMKPVVLTESGFKTGAEGATVAIGTGEGAEETAAGVSGESVKELLETLVPQPTGASIIVQSALNKLFVKNTPENLDKTEKILAELRTPIQVSIEARYVYVRLQEGEDVGIGFKDITGTYNTNQPKPETGTVTTLQKTHTFAGDVLSNITSLSDYGVNLTYAAVLNRLQFTAYLKALQARTDTNTLSAPKVTILDGKSGIVRFVTTITYVKTSKATVVPATDTSAAYVTYDRTFQEKDVGMILNVTPQVAKSTRCVTMFLQPVISEVESWTAYYDSSLSASLPYYMPNFYSKDVQTWVTVHDGDTVVLGGYMEDATGKSVTKVPFLSDIPLLGGLFKYKSKSTSKKKLLIFVTVNIVDASGNTQFTPQGTL